jgi:hypothetical protein
VLELIKLVLVVAITPFTFVVKMKLLVVVAMVSELVVEEAKREEIVLVATLPLTSVVSMLVFVLELTKLESLTAPVFTKFVVVALVAVRLVKNPVTTFNRLENRLVEVELTE